MKRRLLWSGRLSCFRFKGSRCRRQRRKGLLYVYEGFLASLKGEKLSDKAAALPSLDDLVSAEHHKTLKAT
ncbi:hypothetical protein PO124_01055 [Bacillus licheniformis]|nr:hypothetical protein [Bacillus licheniformis]